MKLTLLLIPLLFLSSCSIDWNDEKDAKIAELQKQVTELKQKNDDEVFKKKQECIKKFETTYRDGWYIYYTDIKTNVFYSPSQNTCIVSLDGWEKETGQRVFSIYDMLARKALYSFSVNENWEIKQKKNLEGNLDNVKCNFNKALSELGGDYYFDINCTPWKE